MTVNHDRLLHIFENIEHDNLTEAEERLVISYEEQYMDREWLSDKQIDILENIFRRAAER